MNRRLAMGLSYLAGAVMSAALIVLLNVPDRDPATAVPASPAASPQAMPRSREHAAVLQWMFEHRPDAADLEFLSWAPPRQVSDNPFTRAPATLVKVVVK